MASFTLNLKDGCDLRNNKYYYAFGTVVGESVFEEFEVFTDAENQLVPQKSTLLTVPTII